MHAAIRSWFVLPARRAVDSARLCMLILAVCIESTACHRSARPESHLDISTQGRVDSAATVPDSRASYRRAGLLVGSGDVPFVGSIAFIAGTMPDSTLVLIDLSLSDHALTFTREGEAYHAAYDVGLDFERGGSSIRRIATHEQVRVGSFRETTRDEESVCTTDRRTARTAAPGVSAATACEARSWAASRRSRRARRARTSRASSRARR